MKFRERDIQPLTFTAQGGEGEVRSSVQEQWKQRMAEADYPLEFTENLQQLESRRVSALSSHVALSARLHLRLSFSKGNENTGKVNTRCPTAGGATETPPPRSPMLSRDS